MKKLAWSTGLLLAVVAAGAPACTLTVDDGGPLPADDDSGAQPEPEAGTPDDTSTAPDTGTNPDTGAAPDTGTNPDTGTATADTGATDAGSDGALICSLAVDTGSAVCDACIESSCCDALVACDSEPTDASTTECEDIDSCYGDCMFPPADSGVTGGSPSECADACTTGHAAQPAADFRALIACIASSCAVDCQ